MCSFAPWIVLHWALSVVASGCTVKWRRWSTLGRKAASCWPSRAGLLAVLLRRVIASRGMLRWRIFARRIAVSTSVTSSTPSPDLSRNADDSADLLGRQPQLGLGEDARELGRVELVVRVLGRADLADRVARLVDVAPPEQVEQPQRAQAHVPVDLEQAVVREQVELLRRLGARQRVARGLAALRREHVDRRARVGHRVVEKVDGTAGVMGRRAGDAAAASGAACWLRAVKIFACVLGLSLPSRRVAARISWRSAGVNERLAIIHAPRGAASLVAALWLSGPIFIVRRPARNR